MIRGPIRKWQSLKGHSAYGWGVADQALSSLTNFALGILVARSVSTADFGVFNVAFATYLFTLGVNRALTTDPLVIRFSTVERTSWHQAVAGATGLTAWVGLLVGTGCLIVGALTHGPMRSAFLALGLTMPGLLVQDAWRGAFFAARKGSLAFVNDLVWTIALMSSLTVLLVLDAASIFNLVFVWGGSATLAGLVSMRLGGARPQFSAGRRWWQQHRDISGRYVGEFIANNGTSQIALFGVAAIAGFSAAGALRAALIILGPLNILRIGLASVAVPEGARALASEGALGLKKKSIGVTLLLGPASVAWSIAVLLLPDSFGTAVLGANWEPAQRVLLPLAIATAAGSVSIGAITGLRALAAARRSFRVRMFVSGLDLVGALGGAAVAGALGAAWGNAGAMSCGTVAWWQQFRAGLAEVGPGLPDDAGRDGEARVTQLAAAPDGPTRPGK